MRYTKNRNNGLPRVRDSLAALRREIIARGWNRKATFRIVCELVCPFAIAMCGIWIFVVY